MMCRPFQVASTSRCAAHETCGQFISCIAVGPAVSAVWSPSPAATINPRSTSFRIIFKHSYMTLADLHSFFFANSASLPLSGCRRTQKPGKIRDRQVSRRNRLWGILTRFLLSRISEDGVFQQRPFFSQTLRSPRRPSGCRRTKQGTRRQGAVRRYKTENRSSARQAQNERFGLPSHLPGLQVCSSRACDDKAGRIVRRSSSVSLFRNRSGQSGCLLLSKSSQHRSG